MTLAPTLNLVFTAMTASVTLFAAGVLLLRESPRRDQAVFLAAFLLLYATYKINDLLTLSGAFAFAPHLSVITTPVRFLFGAAIFFYARAMIRPEPSWLTRRDLVALIWPIAGVVSVAPFIVMSAAEKSQILTQRIESAELQEWFEWTCGVFFTLFLASALSYLAAAFRLLLNHTKTIRRFFSNLENRSLAWLRTTLLVLAVGWSWHAAAGLWAILGDRPAWIGTLTTCFDLLWLAAIAFFGIVQRPVVTAAEFGEAGPDGGRERYAHSALDERRMARIAGRLDDAMVNERLYRRPDLSLRALSDHLKISPHYVTQTLNAQVGESFFDYVNRHRVEEARELLVTTDDPVLSIAHQVGYNARSTFNSAFKRRFAKTPSVYRRSHRDSGAAGMDPTTAG